MGILLKLLTHALLSLIILLFITITSVNAEGEFKTDYNVTYTSFENSKVEVNQEITLENQTANFYADKFELKIGSIKVEDVKASDASGPLETSVKFENNISTISVKFNQRVIGLGKKNTWSLSYTSSELVTQSGQIWEISIPRLAKSTEIRNYDVEIISPTSFGPIAFAVPQPESVSIEGKNKVFKYNKEQLVASGISMSFGEKQIFEFTLNYHIENSNLTTSIEEITLPPDNNYQKAVYKSIEPKPDNVIVDNDGNFIAKYKLSPKNQLNIVAQGYIEVFSKPFRNIDPKMSDVEKQKYLVPQRYWEIDTAAIKDKSQELKTPKEIYNFVSEYLTYDENKLNLTKIERLGALATLDSPQKAVCMEFTDLFIALARAADIPAKEIVGFAYTQNTRLRPLSLASQGDLLHAWPAYWDDDLGWVQVDPTWGSTSGGLDFFNKLDFNHITFSQRGLSSTNPLPAGSFKKLSNKNKKQVNISFADELPNITSTPNLKLNTNDSYIAGIPVNLNVQVSNIGSSSILGQEIKLETNFLKITTNNPYKINILPPYSNKTVEFSLQSPNFLEKKTDLLILSYADTQISKSITIVPFYLYIFTPQFLISVSIALIIIVLGLLIYKKFHKRKLQFLNKQV